VKLHVDEYWPMQVRVMTTGAIPRARSSHPGKR
jgi:hypothetical protein